jgi:hypothetical protein
VPVALIIRSVRGRGRIADLTELRQLREQRFFGNWDGYIAPENVEASETNVLRLMDALIALGSPSLSRQLPLSRRSLQ